MGLYRRALARKGMSVGASASEMKMHLEASLEDLAEISRVEPNNGKALALQKEVRGLVANSSAQILTSPDTEEKSMGDASAKSAVTNLTQRRLDSPSVKEARERTRAKVKVPETPPK